MFLGSPSKIEKDPFLVDRFELFILLGEKLLMPSRANDPVDQKLRFEAQSEAKSQGNEEASDMDTDYVTALEYGIPPMAGEGIGIDRLTCFLQTLPVLEMLSCFP